MAEGQVVGDSDQLLDTLGAVAQHAGDDVLLCKRRLRVSAVDLVIKRYGFG